MPQKHDAAYYAKHRDRIKATAKRHYWNNRAKRLAQNKAWRQRNKDWQRKYSKEYYAKNRDKKLADQKRYRERHPDRVKASRDKYISKPGVRYVLKVSRNLGIPMAEARSMIY